MPIKNKARPSNSGLEGKLVGLDTDEKNSLSSDFGGGTTLIENEQALNDLIAQGKIYEGMILYRKDTKKFFQVSKSSDGQLTINEFGAGGYDTLIELKMGMTITKDFLNKLKSSHMGCFIVIEKVVYVQCQIYNYNDYSEIYLTNIKAMYSYYYSIDRIYLTLRAGDTLDGYNIQSYSHEFNKKLKTYYERLEINSDYINNYFITTLNEETTAKILQCQNGEMSWVDMPKNDNKTMVLISADNSITLTKEQFDTLSTNTDYIIIVKDNNRDTEGMWLGFYNYDADQGELSIGMQVFTLEGFVKMLNICSFTKDTLTSNYTQALGAGIIPVTQFDAVFSMSTPEDSIQIPLASIPSLSTTLSTQESDFTTITLTDEDIAMIKGKENGLLYANVEDSGFAIGKNLFGVTLLQENTYLLTYITGKLGTVLAFEGGAPASVNFVIDVSTKHITQFAKTLALTNASSLIITKANKIYLSSGVQEEGLDPEPLNKQYYFDTINGKPIIHESSTVNNYVIPTGGTPTLSLVDMSTQKVRTTITETEKNNLAKGVYNQVIYTTTFDNPFDVYSPCKIIVSNGLSGAFAQFDCSPNADKTSGTIQSFTIYDYTIGDKNASGEYPINIVKHQSLNVGGAISANIELNDEQWHTYTNDDYIDFTEEQYNILKNNYIINVSYTLANSKVLLISSFRTNAIDIDNAPNTQISFMWSNLGHIFYMCQTNITEHPRRFEFFNLETQYGIYSSDASKLTITIHNNNANSNTLFYTIPYYGGLDLNKFLKVNGNGNLEWADLPTQKQYYNHFIYLALETTTKGTATIRINFTNSSNELINTLDKLKTALGSTFTIGGNGSIVNGSTYGTTYMLNQNGITGVLNAAQQVFNFTDGTLTITDSVKQA